MRSHLSAAELAALRLPGLPTTERGIREIARREGWPSQQVRAKGGPNGVRSEYPVSALPAPARDALAAREAAAAALSGAAERRMDAALAVLQAFDAFHRTAGGPKTAAEERFCVAYTAGEIAVPDWVRQARPEISAPTLRRLQARLQREGAARLAGRYGNRAGTGRIDTDADLRDLVLGMLVAHPHASNTGIMQAIEARFEEGRRPSMTALKRWVADWKRENAGTFLALTDPDAWRSRRMAAFGDAAEGIVRLNQRWEMDSSPADLLLQDGRHVLVADIDVWSRDAGLLVAKTSKATAIGARLRRSLLDRGQPEIVVTDKGSDYVSIYMIRVFSSLGIDHQPCPPFTPDGKPFVERFFKTFAHGLLELMPGYIGHSVAERQAIRARKSFADRLMTPGETVELRLTASQLQAFCDRWCRDVYAHTPHGGLGGLTPAQRIASWDGPVRRIADERALDVLLAEAPGGDGRRVVQKKGLAIDGTWFIAPELALHIGEGVRVLYDPGDAGRVFVFGGPEDGFLCIAEAPERTGISRAEVAVIGKALQKRALAEEKDALRAARRRARPAEVVEQILDHRARTAAALPTAPGLVALPHSTPALEAAAEAAAAGTPPALPARTDIDADLHARTVAEVAQEEERADRAQETSYDRFRRWLAIDAALAAGTAVAPDERDWHRIYQTTSEYRGLRMVYDEFGPDFLMGQEKGPHRAGGAG